MSALADHPLGIGPWQGTRDEQRRRAAGLGALSQLSDGVLLVLLEFVDAGSLARFGQCSQWTLAFARFEGLWKRLLLKLAKSQAAAFGHVLPTFAGSWYQTYRAAAASLAGRPAPAPAADVALPRVRSSELYAPWYARCLPLQPRWLSHENIPRVSFTTTSTADFVAAYESQNVPVIVTDLVTSWPAYQRWSTEHLLAHYGDTAFTAGPADMRFRDYLRYSASNADDVPLYLFDKRFADKAPALAADYSPPAYFADDEHDLFALLEPAHLRPAYRWLVVGPARSGSRFHQDPNATSAWNAAVRGAKKWVMFPPHVTPPGVFPSSDGADVTSPLSLLEWFTGFYEQARSTGEMKECVLREGELMFVPSRWWHLVVNLDWSVAITHNFVSACNLANVMYFLEHQPDSVSGMLTDDVAKNELFTRFKECIQQKRPALYAQLDQANQRKVHYKAIADDWDQVANDPDADSFSFL